jgi:hypothetical protein
MEMRMNAGPKPNSKKSLAPRQSGKIPDQAAAAVDKGATSPLDASTKSDKPERKAEFGQATLYRQGVLVPRGAQKSTMPRTRSR